MEKRRRGLRLFCFQTATNSTPNRVTHKADFRKHQQLKYMKHHLFTLVARSRMRLSTWIFRILSKIELFQFKYLLRTRDSTLHLIRLQIRSRFFPANLEGDDETTDRIVWLATLYLVGGEPSDRETITAEVETKARSIVSNAHSVHGLADSLSTFLGLGQLVRKITGKASSLGTEHLQHDGKPILPKEILQKDVFRINKKLRSEIKELKRVIADRKGHKIDLDFTSISQAISLVSICFLLTGYLYSSLFLSRFGIPSTHYFTVSDYLATSLDVISQ